MCYGIFSTFLKSSVKRYKTDYMSTGKYIQKMRLEKKISQAELSRLIKRPAARICEWEQDIYSIKLDVFLEIAVALKYKNFNKLFKN